MVAHLDREVDVTVCIQSICVIAHYKPLGPNSHGHIKESERRAFNQKYIDELVDFGLGARRWQCQGLPTVKG